MYQQVLITILIAAVMLAAIFMLIRALFYRQIQRVAREANADIIVWMLYQQRWSGEANEVLYAWRKVLWELKNMHAPADQIEAARRSVKYYERHYTKAESLVSPSAKVISRVTIGGTQ